MTITQSEITRVCGLLADVIKQRIWEATDPLLKRIEKLEKDVEYNSPAAVAQRNKEAWEKSPFYTPGYRCGAVTADGTVVQEADDFRLKDAATDGRAADAD